MPVVELHLTVEEKDVVNQLTVVDLIANACQLNRSEIKQAIHKGALWHEKQRQKGSSKPKRLRRIKTKLASSDNLHFYYNENVLKQTVDDAVLVEDYQDYSVWFKPYGMLSQGSKWSDHCTIQRFVNYYFNGERSCFIVHRLDRAASGLIIIAHSKKAAQLLSAMFERHNLNKRYHIFVHGDFSKLAQEKCVEQSIDGKQAKSTFTFVAYDKDSDISKLSVLIETGRKHQIRKHAAFLGYPVVGDRLHGNAQQAENKNEEVDLQLQAMALSFVCPITKALREITLPENYHLGFKD